ncbi:hypothetical protein BUALT_Bualt05G0073100 [Buddleja alternifolia]|uniref:Transposase Tnp1/En/Spm-like domain-containing protein n=1 Tax=Buddleja alternifolia TaxID=168488 RepID=A0AAV6XQS5_9LAMI|nr:hypothetical protein BUALT_Bualt05G0073100 [Buddleja alternifolia]
MGKKVPKRMHVVQSTTSSNSQSDRSSTLSECREIKRTKGAIYMPEIWALPPGIRLQVDCNQFGQPIDNNRSKFACFLGVLSRTHTYAPIDIFDWRKMPKSKKKDMLDLLKEKFVCPIGTDEWILQSISVKWRNWKHDLKFDYFDPTLPLDDLIKEGDERVNEEQWRKLIMFWLSDEGKVQARKMGCPPTRVETYKKCFPVENGEEAGEIMGTMQTLTNKLVDPSQDVLTRNDGFAISVGADKPERVRMMGLGVTPTDGFEDTLSRKACHRMLMENMAATQKLSEELEACKQQIANQQSLNEVTPPIVSSPPLTSPQQYTNLNLASTNVPQPLQDNCSVVLMSIIHPSKVVAKGHICSMDPTVVVAGEQLGNKWCSVHINVAIDREERLIRSGFMFQTIGEAIGAAVAWPSALVSFTCLLSNHNSICSMKS